MSDARSPDPLAAQRWQRIEALLDGALDLPPAGRAAFLAQACADDSALRAEVERLLAAVDAPSGPLPADPAGPAAIEFAAPFVARTLATESVEIAAAAAAAVPQPVRIGAWRVLARAGEGGMGTVFLVARDDGEFRMRAALKIVRAGLHLDAASVRRFREERQILAHLDHPGLARLLDGGVTAEGLPYYVMEYVDGAAIDRWCDARRAGIPERLQLFAQVCDAVAAAHRAGIVHRDIKPSNVLVNADGEPKLLDFGIAKPLASHAGHAAARHGGPEPEASSAALTRTGERLLTPEYASPEQVRGEPVTPATDIYSLGVLLYELLTGQRPYHPKSRTRHEIERAILDETPTRPSALATRTAADAAAASAAARSTSSGELQRRLRGDLDAIVLTALRKDPGRRYASVTELAADVRRHLAGERVQARGDSVAYRTGVWLRRHRRTAIAGTVGLLAGVVLIAGFAARSLRYRPAEWAEARLLADSVSTRSPAAHRYYEDGLRAFAGGRHTDALQLFRAALAADSTFAMAAYYGSAAASLTEDYAVSGTLLEQSVRQAERVSERERLIVRANYAARLKLPTLGAYADSLARLYPGSVLGAVWGARAALNAGDWLRVVELGRQVVTADSLSLDAGLVPCYACDALTLIVNAYVYADSLAAAEREAVRAVHLRPGSAAAWRDLAHVQLWRGTESDSAFRHTVELDPGDADWAVEWSADWRLRRGEFAAADELLRARIQTAPPHRVERSLGLLIASLRMQERWPEALELAARFRTLGPPQSAWAIHRAQVLMESGDPRRAAALFDSISRWRPETAPTTPELRIWAQTHRAAALAAAGDTGALAAIADTIEALAPLSGNGRDALLPYHVRGLLHAARGADDAAVAAFRRALFSPTRGYTRTNLELARALLRLGRPQEAVAALQPAFRGALEVNNSYVTRTVLHRALADAWRAAGERDSAAAHDAWVARDRRRP